ncbi:uncharacterized protein LOC132917676 isoform X2 [Rhopalosiphum padi]|uniref:uncharacterized protein LOC132917676 isoform X2 n=1 Tax=Rhopalosiphum padi TaxID=40932 RepID=UPI00298D8074|nr:uncharacterized protein LOC132917676 isoform X2 [Rhopalosiphum padi]
MLMILKTFKLSKSLVHLLYVLLIITTVISYQIKDETDNPSDIDDENNNPDEDIRGDRNHIESNDNNPTGNNEYMNNELIKNVFSRMGSKGKKPSQIGSSGADAVEDQQPEEEIENDPTRISLGLDSEPENTEGTDFKEANFENIEDEKPKKKKKRSKKKNHEEKDIRGSDNIKDQQPEEEIENDPTRISLGLDSDPENTEGTDFKEANVENIEDEKPKKKKKRSKKKSKNRKQKKTEDDETELIEMNTNGINDLDHEEKDIRGSDNIKDQQQELDKENDPTEMLLGLSNGREAELDKEKTEINLQKEKTDVILAESKATESDNIESTIEQTSKSSDPEKNPIDDIKEDTTKNTITEIDQKDLTISSLENVGIVKIKNSDNATSEAIRKKKKKTKFREFTHSGGNARIYCTFLGDMLKMYNKVKKRFVGHFCHAIVVGTPIILRQNQVHLSNNMKNQLNKIEPHKQESLLIVIMKFSSYRDWKHALKKANSRHLITNIIHMVKTYKIDGIQFSNLQPIAGKDPDDSVDTHMMNNLLKFFEKLLNIARNNHNYDLKIGITIHLNSQWITSSFNSFDVLNKLVTWYTYETISMVTCSPEYKDTGTSPLEGDVSLMNAYNTLTDTDIQMSKVVVGIQLFPNKVNELEPLTYEELCSTPKDTWNEWCAAHPEKLRLKGMFLRNNEIGGVQLFYMHSDDYRSTCGCYSFPLTRALLRGLINTQAEEQCDFNTAHN